MLASRHDVVIVGGGQAGLAMSRCLSRRDVDHVVLERSSVGSAWAGQRWDSLRLLTPNWMTRLPDAEAFSGDPDGFAAAADVRRFLQRYACHIAAPVVTGCDVERIDPRSDGWRISTSMGTVTCRAVVLATGPAATARVPGFAGALGPSTPALTPLTYKSPRSVGDGRVLVVGASASGVQIADELARAGRDVVLAVGEHVRAVRTYRGRDLYWWLDRAGLLDEPYDTVDDIARVRATPSFQVVGSDDARGVALADLQARGVELVGRLVGIDDQRFHFSGSLPNLCRSADLKLERLLDRFDAVAAEHGDAPGHEPWRPARTVLGDVPVDTGRTSIRTVVWATGLAPSFPTIGAAVFDGRGRLRHDGGVTPAPGLYVLGLPFLRRRRSSFIDGAGGDAEAIATDLIRNLDCRAVA